VKSGLNPEMPAGRGGPAGARGCMRNLRSAAGQVGRWQWLAVRSRRRPALAASDTAATRPSGSPRGTGRRPLARRVQLKPGPGPRPGQAFEQVESPRPEVTIDLTGPPRHWQVAANLNLKLGFSPSPAECGPPGPPFQWAARVEAAASEVAARASTSYDSESPLRVASTCPTCRTQLGVSPH
jgi:hypothetical protein